MTVKDGAVTVFTGFVEDFDYAYGVDNRSEATMSVRDALATLGTTNLNDWAPEQQLTGARISALLNRSEVAFPLAGRSIATGTQLTYHPADERYVVTGTPVKLNADCKESTGKTLTFFKSSDRVIIDGNEENRTQTKGGRCPGTPH